MKRIIDGQFGKWSRVGSHRWWWELTLWGTWLCVWCMGGLHRVMRPITSRQSRTTIHPYMLHHLVPIHSPLLSASSWNSHGLGKPHQRHLALLLLPFLLHRNVRSLPTRWQFLSIRAHASSVVFGHLWLHRILFLSFEFAAVLSDVQVIVLQILEEYFLTRVFHR